MTRPLNTANRLSRGKLPEKTAARKARLTRKDTPMATGASVHERLSAAKEELNNIKEAAQECLQEKTLVKAQWRRSPVFSALFLAAAAFSLTFSHIGAFVTLFTLSIWFAFVTFALKKAITDYEADEAELDKEEVLAQDKVNKLQVRAYGP